METNDQESSELEGTEGVEADDAFGAAFESASGLAPDGQTDTTHPIKPEPVNETTDDEDDDEGEAKEAVDPVKDGEDETDSALAEAEKAGLARLAAQGVVEPKAEAGAPEAKPAEAPAPKEAPVKMALNAEGWPETFTVQKEDGSVATYNTAQVMKEYEDLGGAVQTLVQHGVQQAVGQLVQSGQFVPGFADYSHSGRVGLPPLPGRRLQGDRRERPGGRRGSRLLELGG